VPLAGLGRGVVEVDHFQAVPRGDSAGLGHRHVDAVLHPGALGNHRALHRPRGVDAKLALRALLGGRVHGDRQSQHRAQEDSEPHPSAHSVPLPRDYDVSNRPGSAPSLAGCWRYPRRLSRAFLDGGLGYPVAHPREGHMPEPRVIYEGKPGSPIAVDRPLYDRLAAETHSRRLVERFVVPMRSGRAWPVRAGQLFRIVAVEGPQVADFNAWNLGNPRERFWAARTKQLHRAHVTTYDRLWSCLPYLRPMLTITNDSIRYGRDEDGAGCHDLLGTRCDPYVHKMLNGEDFDLCCHSNLVRAVAPYRLNELDIHDVLNVFQVTGLTADDRYLVKDSPAKKGDFLEFFAEIDVLCAISRCPHGDLSVQMWGADAGDPLATCRPLGVEIWQPDPALLAGWRPPTPADYRGDHRLARSARGPGPCWRSGAPRPPPTIAGTTGSRGRRAATRRAGHGDDPDPDDSGP